MRRRFTVASKVWRPRHVEDTPCAWVATTAYRRVLPQTAASRRNTSRRPARGTHIHSGPFLFHNQLVYECAAGACQFCTAAPTWRSELFLRLTLPDLADLEHLHLDLSNNTYSIQKRRPGFARPHPHLRAITLTNSNRVYWSRRSAEPPLTHEFAHALREKDILELIERLGGGSIGVGPFLQPRFQIAVISARLINLALDNPREID
ncbi:hypothetical protein K438DRAFT_1789267 [Mycena galopus ATCC 62051]|nr:hypothetical protein K438DRAFT_1789267 [Mycena galopus ATCC 62051]